jgi:hypothetical protein
MDAVCSSETLANVYRPTRRHGIGEYQRFESYPEDGGLHVSLKRRYPPTALQGVTAHSTMHLELYKVACSRIAQSNSDYGPGEGRAIAQAISRRLPIAAARVRAQVRSRGIYGGQSGTEAGFLRVRLFPLPILITPIAPHSSSIIRGW